MNVTISKPTPVPKRRNEDIKVVIEKARRRYTRVPRGVTLRLIEEIDRLTRELAEARLQRCALLPWVHVWDDRNHCRQCDGHGRHLPDCSLKAALGAAKGGVT